ncbi:MAG: hypothetical protein JWO94_353 [Verrucomicrobiaceae bacterium]|nr:hypothetical protein [Verrucomicrobiaceae bacterium]
MKLFPLAIACVCLLTLAARPFITAAEPAAKDELHTPDRASAERKAIIEAVHAEYSKNDSARTEATVEFIVPYLKVHNGWAWIEIHPRTKDGQQAFEPQSELYHLKNGKWTFMDALSGEADADPAKDIRAMKKKFPALPHDILPQVEGS